MSSVISKAADCSVYNFMACLFDDNLSVLIISGEPAIEELQKAFSAIHTEFLDLSKQFIPEIQLMREVYELESRNKEVSLLLYCQSVSINELQTPYYGPDGKALDYLAKNGRRLNWKNDVEDFKRQIKFAETAEVKLIELLKTKNKELEKVKAENENKKTAVNSRIEFIRLLNELQKYGYRIDKHSTTVEELAVMTADFCSTMEKAAGKNKLN